MIDDLSISVLSWKAPETIRNTLASYRESGLFGLTDDFTVFFNERTSQDDRLAAEFGVSAAGSSENLGIWGGMLKMEALMRHDYLLLLQNDNPVCVSTEEAERWLKEGVSLLKDGKADLVRMRHRFLVGEGFSDVDKYLKLYPCHDADVRFCLRELTAEDRTDTVVRRYLRMVRPFKALRMIGRAPYVERRPETLFPRQIRREGDFFIVDSSVINFTEQPFLISRSRLREMFELAAARRCRKTVNGFPVMEVALNSSCWRRRHYRIAICDTGVFTHARVDDSWRETHAAFNESMR